MKLMYSPTSPYVRKAMVLAIERGLDRKIEKVAMTASPITENKALDKVNPLAKVPALELDNGMTLFDSPVICEYLDSKHRGDKVFPASGARRWKALRQQAIGDGILDAALLARYEGFMRPENLRWPDWAAGQKRKFTQALDLLEKEVKDLSGGLTIGHITIACALGYLDFRFGDMGWRTGRPKLAAWYDKFARRKSMQATIPPT
ncbi:MAG: Glutathione S-transferase domain protein [Alphaproteobacteria bacterium]|nr:Glutathione S-transferase domain protein [Alphaproteobacteria bacterium]